MLIVILAACTNTHTKQEEVQTIDGTSMLKVDIESLFPSAKIIPLQTDDQALVGVAISKVEQYNDKLFLLNRLTTRNNILCFDTLGRFLFNIDNIGHGPQEYTILSDFILDRNAKQIILCSEQGSFLRYDLDGNFIEKFSIKTPYFARQTLVKDDSTFIAYNDGSIIDTQPFSLIELDSKSLEIKNHPTSLKKPCYESVDPLLIYGDEMFYNDFNDTIYRVTDINTRLAEYYVNFGAKHNDDKSDVLRYCNDNNTSSHGEYFYNKYQEGRLKVSHNSFHTRDWIAISYSQFDEGLKQQFLLYDIVSQRSFVSNNIDFTSLGLEPKENISIIGRHNEQFIGIAYNRLTTGEKKNIEKQLMPESKNLIDYESDLNNPILIILQ